MRNTFRFLCAQVPKNTPKAMNDVFALRRAPKSLHTPNMRSNTLSDHPVTNRAAQQELSYQQRVLSERGEYDRAAAIEMDAAKRVEEGRSGQEASEYRNVVIVMVLGYLTAHSVVYRYYYPDDVRFSYAPDVGYTGEVERRREVLQAVDEHVGFRVLEQVRDAKRAKYKVPLV